MLKKQQKNIKRRKRVRAKISGTNSIPRFSVFRSNRNIYAQLIDDEKGVTLIAASDKELKPKVSVFGGKTQNLKPQLKTKNSKEEEKKNKKEIIKTGKTLIAYEIGKLIAEKAIKKNIKKVVFDRGGRKYHGRVKAVAEGAREVGLIF
jgi:large subunit ribosomal protein L18